MVVLNVHGHPAPQGSKRHVGRGIMVEASKKVQPWREAVVGEIIRSGHNGAAIGEPVSVAITFWVRRPKSHLNAIGNVKPSAPTVPTARNGGDIDKLVRSTLDALVQGALLEDDSIVVDLTARKRYATLAHPQGAAIRIDIYRGDTYGTAD